MFRDNGLGWGGPMFLRENWARLAAITGEHEAAAVEELETRRRRWLPIAWVGPSLLIAVILLSSHAGRFQGPLVTSAAVLLLWLQLPLVTLCSVGTSGFLSAFVAGALYAANDTAGFDPVRCVIAMAIAAISGHIILRNLMVDAHLWAGYVGADILLPILAILLTPLASYNWPWLLIPVTALIVVLWRVAVLPIARRRLLRRIVAEELSNLSTRDLLVRAGDAMAFWRFVRTNCDSQRNVRVGAVVIGVVMLLLCLAVGDYRNRLGLSRSDLLSSEAATSGSDPVHWLYGERGTLLTTSDLQQLYFYVLSTSVQANVTESLSAGRSVTVAGTTTPVHCASLGSGTLRIASTLDFRKAIIVPDQSARAWRCREADSPSLSPRLTPVEFFGHRRSRLLDFERRISATVLHTATFSFAAFVLLWTWRPSRGFFWIACALWAAGVAVLGPSSIAYILAGERFGSCFFWFLPTFWKLTETLPHGVLALAQVLPLFASFMISSLLIAILSGISTSMVIDYWAQSHSDSPLLRSPWPTLWYRVAAVFALSSIAFLPPAAIPVVIVGTAALWAVWLIRKELSTGAYRDTCSLSVYSKVLFAIGSLSVFWTLRHASLSFHAVASLTLTMLLFFVIVRDRYWEFRKNPRFPLVGASALAILIELTNQLLADYAEDTYLVPHSFSGLVSLGLAIFAFDKMREKMRQWADRNVIDRVLPQNKSERGMATACFRDSDGEKPTQYLHSVMSEAGLRRYVLYTSSALKEGFQLFRLSPETQPSSESKTCSTLPPVIRVSQRLLMALRQERILRQVHDQLSDPAFALHVPELWRLQSSFGGPRISGGIDRERMFCTCLLSVDVGETVVGLLVIAEEEIPEAATLEPATRKLRELICLSLISGAQAA